jgi:transposase-like protein
MHPQWPGDDLGMDLEALIAARPGSRSDLGAWYFSIPEAAEPAGLSIAQLSKLLGCSRETLYAWRRRLDGTAAAGGTRVAPPAGLVRVTVSEADAGEVPSPVPPLEVRTRSGRGVLVPPGFDPDQLAAIVEVLEAC